MTRIVVIGGGGGPVAGRACHSAGGRRQSGRPRLGPVGGDAGGQCRRCTGGRHRTNGGPAAFGDRAAPALRDARACTRRADVGGWPILPGVRQSRYAKPDAGCILMLPADEYPVDAHDACAGEETPACGIAAYDDMTKAQVKRLLASWAGLRGFAPDRTLVPGLGPDPDQPACLWCAARDGYGMQTPPAAARLVAGLVSGRPPALPACAVDALRPERLR